MRTSYLLPAAVAIALYTNGCSKATSEYHTDATIKDIMDSVVDPNADYVWDSVSIISNMKGIVEKAPKTDEEWKEVRRHTVALMEATNLLLIPGRKVARPGEKADDPRVELGPDAIQSMIDADRASWVEHAHTLYDSAATVLKAVDAKNSDGILQSGDLIDQACEACHLKYWYPRQLEKSASPSTSMKKSPTK